MSQSQCLPFKLQVPYFDIHSVALVPPSLANPTESIPIGGSLNVNCQNYDANNILLDVQRAWLDALGNVVNNAQTLEIRGAVVADAGNYMCRFVSNLGENAQATFTLMVVGTSV